MPLALDGDYHPGLRFESVVGRTERLIPVGCVRWNNHIELELARPDQRTAHSRSFASVQFRASAQRKQGYSAGDLLSLTFHLRFDRKRRLIQKRAPAARWRAAERLPKPDNPGRQPRKCVGTAVVRRGRPRTPSGETITTVARGITAPLSSLITPRNTEDCADR